MPEDLVVVVAGAELCGEALDAPEGVEHIDAEGEVLPAEAIVQTSLVGRLEGTGVLEVIEVLRSAEVDIIPLDGSIIVVEEGEPFLRQLVEGNREDRGKGIALTSCSAR